MRDEPVHEGELVAVFLRLRRVAVRQIDRGDADDAPPSGNDRLDIAGLLIVRSPGSPRATSIGALASRATPLKPFCPCTAAL